MPSAGEVEVVPPDAGDRLSDYDFDLPADRIAQHPAERRDESRLLALIGERTLHLRFSDIQELLAPGDLLVVNDTKVMPARLWARRSSGARIEVLLLEERQPGAWLAMVRPGRKAQLGDTLLFEGATATVAEITPDGERLLRFDGDVHAIMRHSGALPLPPYITARQADPDRYQTVYAQREGAVAAPTAGLHFTPALLAKLAERGIDVAPLTLHVGPGTFKPVKVEDVAQHRMHGERFEIPAATVAAIRRAKGRGGRVIAVGTTATRALEAAARGPNGLEAATGVTDLFIRPGFPFAVVDGLITNFHLPRSTLLMLVSALCEHQGNGGLPRIRAAYQTAIAEGYRFYSFGDAMILLGDPAGPLAANRTPAD